MARVTQLLNLTLLAPSIQAVVVHMQGPTIAKRTIRIVSREPLWRDQLTRWRHILPEGRHGRVNGALRVAHWLDDEDRSLSGDRVEDAEKHIVADDHHQPFPLFREQDQ